MKPELQKFVDLLGDIDNTPHVDAGVLWYNSARLSFTIGDLRALVRHLQECPGAADYHRGYEHGFRLGYDSASQKPAFSSEEIQTANLSGFDAGKLAGWNMGRDAAHKLLIELAIQTLRSGNLGVVGAYLVLAEDIKQLNP